MKSCIFFVYPEREFVSMYRALPPLAVLAVRVHALPPLAVLAVRVHAKKCTAELEFQNLSLL